MSRSYSGQGLSPHVRGKRFPHQPCLFQQGPIPARAGETRNEFGWYADIRAYPRTCGGNHPRKKPLTAWRGLSPHVRGKLMPGYCSVVPMGPIPARAGETEYHADDDEVAGAYPRTCGGNLLRHRSLLVSWGLSPHVRGKLRYEFGNIRHSGPIPARAGETRRGLPRLSDSGAYPRTCGGNFGSRPYSVSGAGLSPHVRGKLVLHSRRNVRLGPIPARAGETRYSLNIRWLNRAYPRTCGGNFRTRKAASQLRGLSPHVRGKLISKTDCICARGPIPARAGETL